MTLIPDRQGGILPNEALVVKLNRFGADGPTVTKSLDGFRQRVEQRPPGPQSDRRPAVTGILLGSSRDERSDVHVVVRAEVWQGRQHFGDEIQISDDCVALAPPP